jgi:ABC-type branched-subunit amino acid transport system ATPase component/branched-subunit amino acid ABC-type transport system permease component
MTQFVQFAILGLGVGAVYVLLADGLVLIYRGAGTLNFAQAAYAMFGAYAFYELHTADHWPLPWALIAALVLGMVIGALTHLLVMRPLRHASPLARLIATLGVLLVLEGLATVKYQADDFIVSSFFPNGEFHLSGLLIPEQQLFLVLIAVVLTVALDLSARHTTVGLSLLAVSENPQAASALGWSPEIVSVVTWSAGGVLAAAAGVLIAPLSGLAVSSFTLVIVSALAVALTTGFQSFRITLIAGIILGILESETALYAANYPGVSDAVPFFAIIIVLSVRGRSLPARSDIRDRLPTIGNGILRPKTILVLAGILLVLILTVLSTELTTAVSIQLAVSVILLGVVVVTGYAGQLSLAPYALAGLGAYFAGSLVAILHWSFFAALIGAIVGSALIGVIFGLPALRVRGVSLAIVTTGMALAVDGLIFSSSGLTGGLTGTTVGAAKLFGFNIDPIAYPDRYAIFSLVTFILVALGVSNLRRSRAGRRLIAVRSNERAAASLGVNVTQAKLFAFAIASAVSGVGGVLLGFQTHTIVYTQFDPITSINSVSWSTIGGIGFIPGALVGSGFATGSVGSYILDQFGSLEAWLTVIGGLSVLVTLLINPDGIVGAISQGKGDPIARYIYRKLHERRLARLEPAVAVQYSEPPSELRNTRKLALEVVDLTVRYGGVTAVSSFSLRVDPGEVVGLVGPNGAGKTSFVDAISGFVSPASGLVHIGGRDLAGHPPQQRAAMGLTRSFQSVELFEDLTVAENMLVATEPKDALAYLSTLVLPGRRSNLGPVTACLASFGIGHILDKRPSTLSHAQRRLVGIARAVVTRPAILLLDEPAAGLDESERGMLSQIVRDLATKLGLGILLIEHNMDMVMSLCDRVAVMDFGRKIADGPPLEVRKNPEVVKAYLGVENPPSQGSQVDIANKL